MPVYMDRHDVPEAITPEDVAQIHQQDLQIQHKFGCRALTYWFDEARNKAFCLIEAPNKEAMLAMHRHSHGQVPNKIIEVEENILESFYGRIENPEKPHHSDLHINNDPPSRVIMVIGIKMSSLKIISKTLNKSLQNYSISVIKELNHFEGSIVNHRSDSFLVSFKSVSRAVSCALNIKAIFETFAKKNKTSDIVSKIAIHTGIPVTDKDQLFESTIKLAEWMCHIVKEKLVVSSEVKSIYQSENLNSFIDERLIHALIPADEIFLNLLMEYMEDNWREPDLKVGDFGKHLGYSKSQLYRKMISLTGKSPNALLKEYRLDRALLLFNKQKGNISEIAFETGFNSPAYFSKCFLERYEILPSDYTRIFSKIA